MAEDILKQLQDNRELLQNKLVFLQRDKIIKVDAGTRFQLEQEIKEVQTQIQEITREIENLQTKPAIAPTVTPTSPSSSPSSSNISIPLTRILHLSDLHFGNTDDAYNWYDTLAQDLRYELGCDKLDALILSGDIANKSIQEEYIAAKQFIDDLASEFQLTPKQIILAPGNHDLNWQISEAAYTLQQRKCYRGYLDENHIIDKGENIEVLDSEQYKQRFTYFSYFYQEVKGENYPLEYEEQGILNYLPEQNLLILSLNSAWQLDHHYRTRASIHPRTISNALKTIRQNPAYQSCIKIAVWHHPLNSPYEDRIKDTGFMERLAQAGFRFALHGHIHKAENSLYRYDLNTTGRKLDIICAGTFGAPIREWVPGYPLQYNLLKLEDNKLTVQTRRREELNGAWKPDARWLMGAGQNPLPYYEIVDLD
jgi:3',5'-cyclic AMP phosphodiesterase CpdA